MDHLATLREETYPGWTSEDFALAVISILDDYTETLDGIEEKFKGLAEGVRQALEAVTGEMEHMDDAARARQEQATPAAAVLLNALIEAEKNERARKKAAFEAAFPELKP